MARFSFSSRCPFFRLKNDNTSVKKTAFRAILSSDSKLFESAENTIYNARFLKKAEEKAAKQV